MTFSKACYSLLAIVSSQSLSLICFILLGKLGYISCSLVLNWLCSISKRSMKIDLKNVLERALAAYEERYTLQRMAL